jgi:hypothetical protein
LWLARLSDATQKRVFQPLAHIAEPLSAIAVISCQKPLAKMPLICARLFEAGRYNHSALPKINSPFDLNNQ